LGPLLWKKVSQTAGQIWALRQPLCDATSVTAAMLRQDITATNKNGGMAELLDPVRT